eukprot:Lankesteria_metandrocarpae@DN9348_c0_g1_i1.p2
MQIKMQGLGALDSGSRTLVCSMLSYSSSTIVLWQVVQNSNRIAARSNTEVAQSWDSSSTAIQRVQQWQRKSRSNTYATHITRVQVLTYQMHADVYACIPIFTGSIPVVHR